VVATLRPSNLAPKTIISWPVHAATASVSATGALAMARHESVAGRYAAPSAGTPAGARTAVPHTISSSPVHTDSGARGLIGAGGSGRHASRRGS
jgi:hypothetical protein